ncbi:MAG: hypothetical protein HY658_04050, partial [Actinobacteria bacterium]|nr:hypothetical protein [Actinomycetota bacterium]
MIARVAAAAVAAGLTLIGGLWVGGRGGVVEVPAGTDVTAVIAETPPWTTLRLGPGVHGPFTVTRPGAVVGAPGASVRG